MPIRGSMLFGAGSQWQENVHDEIEEDEPRMNPQELEPAATFHLPEAHKYKAVCATLPLPQGEPAFGGTVKPSASRRWVRVF